jgi:hypothetical protein
MTLAWRIVVTLSVIALVTAVQPSCAYACSCRPPGPPAEALANATAVFSGKVTALSAPVDGGGTDPVQVTFAVTNGWKGADQSTIVIVTPSSSASCGVGLVEGQEYLVYATESEGSLQTNLCSRTTQLAMAGEDLAVLGAGTPPNSGGGAAPPVTMPATGDAPRWSNLQQLELVGGALLVIVLGAVVKRRHAAA